MTPGRRVDAYRTDLPPARVWQALARHTRSVAALAYLHALPAFLHLRQLTEFVQARRAYAPDEPPLGGWLLMRRPSDPSVTTVSPNVDTLYGAAYLLLDRQGPMVVTLPPMPDRYHSVAVLDAYFTTVDIIGTTTEAGGGGSYLVAPPGWSQPVPPGIRRVVVTTTPSVSLFQRIYLRGPDDLEAVHALQDAVTLMPLSQWTGAPDDRPVDLPVDLPPYLAPYETQGLRSVSDPLLLLELTSSYTETNLPDDPALVALFRAAGVGPGSTLPQDPLLRAAAGRPRT